MAYKITKTMLAYKISSRKVEGSSNLIKTVRRKAYGYRDKDYFFLKIMDESRREYVRNPKSHKKYDWAFFINKIDYWLMKLGEVIIQIGSDLSIDGVRSKF